MMESEVITVSDTESARSMLILNHNKQPLQITESKGSSPSYKEHEQSLQNHTIKYLNSHGSSPSPRAKVSDWLLANYQASNIGHNLTSNVLPFFADNKSSILIRQDYAKPHLPTFANCLANSNEQDKSKCTVVSVTSSVCSSLESNHNTDPTQNTTMMKGVEKKSSKSCDIPFKSTKMSGISANNLPLNVEVPNKLELCSYLKLMNMNPKDLRTVGFKQNRRSSRVKNLAIMSQQKALERELNTVSIDDKKNSPDSSLCSASSKEIIYKSFENIQRSFSGKEEISVPNLQVPEVSTTCVLRPKSPNRSRSCILTVGNRKSLGTPCSLINSPIATRSLSSASVTKYGQEENTALQNMHFHLVEYLHKIPPTNFDDFYSSHFKHVEPPNPSKKEEADKSVFNTFKNKSRRSKIMIHKLKYKLRRNLRPQESANKSKHRPTHQRQSNTSKHQKRLKLYLRKRDLTKLRSRGKLKEIGIKSVLLNHDRRKKIKKKPKRKLTPTVERCQEKDFRSADLIQSAPENTQFSTALTDDKLNLSINKCEISPTKLFKLKSDLDLLKNLTPEHRKALFESKKFLIMKTNTILNANGASGRTMQDNQCTNHEENVKTVSQCDIRTQTPTLFRVASPMQFDNESSQPCSEDDEVDKLMNYNNTKNVSKEVVSPPVSLSSMKSVAQDLKEQYYCESVSSKSQTSTSTDHTVENQHNSTPSSPKLFQTDACESSSTPESEEKIDNISKNKPEVVDISDIQRTSIDSVNLIENNETKIKSLHQCLTQPRKKTNLNTKSVCGKEPMKSDKRVSQSYAIDLSSCNGAIMNAYYLDYNLVIVQELLVSFWTQTPLGNVLGAQNMWMPKGDTKRLVLGNGCIRQDSSDTVMVLDTSIAYFELWTKEHVSDRRERPVADIFVTIYLKVMGSAPDKKVLQLENIHGYANDVQYIVIKNFPIIVVSWNTINDQLTSTVVHKYRLSPDYQTVTDITSMHAANHYISSLHNIEDSDTLIMGCGEDKITLWHLDDGYVVATMDLMVPFQQPRTLWAKADRGFIFTLHNFNDGDLHLIATNSFDYSWKQLQVYKQESDYENLLGICIENGLVIAFYDTGIVCWKAISGELILDTVSENNIFLPFGKHIVIITKDQVQVRHVLEYLVTIDEDV